MTTESTMEEKFTVILSNFTGAQIAEFVGLSKAEIGDHIAEWLENIGDGDIIKFIVE